MTSNGYETVCAIAPVGCALTVPRSPSGTRLAKRNGNERASGKLQGVWLWISVISTLRLWVLGASSFFKQLLFGFSVFDFEAKVFDHL